MRRGPDLRAGGRILVLGGNSEIALALVGELQRQAPREVCLVGRDRERLEWAAQGLREGGVSRALTFELDALDFPSHAARLREADRELGGADIAILAVGVLGAASVGEDPARAVEVLQTNTVGAGSLLMQASEIMAERAGGTIVVLSSVAAERPRPSNAVYGASKAGLDALARGLADRLWAQGVRVLVVRPGFVFTRMTAGLEPAPMAVGPQQVAGQIVQALEEGRQIVRVPRRLGPVMLVVRLMPRALLRRMKL